LSVDAAVAPTNVVFVNGTNFADALSASALANQNSASVVLLPPSGVLSAGALARATAATNVFIVGGSSVLPNTLETQLLAPTTSGGAGKLSANVIRIAGDDRYETAALVAARIGGTNVASFNGKKTAILVSGTSFADAVIAGPVAEGPVGAAGVHPILLTAADSLPISTRLQLQTLGVTQVVIIGGTTPVSAAVETAVTALGISVVRIAGANRYDTAAKVAAVLQKSVAAGGFGWTNATVGLANLESNASGQGGFDALSAAALLGPNDQVLLGVTAAALPSETAAFLTATTAVTNGLRVFGGTTPVPAAVVNSAITTLGGSLTSPTATISGATDGASTFTVTLSEKVTAVGNPVSVTAASNGAQVGAPVGVSLNAAGTVATVTLTGYTLKPGDTVSVLSSATNNFATASPTGRTVGIASATVAADTTKPVASLISAINATPVTSALVSFSEPVLVKPATFDAAGIAGLFTYDGAAVPGTVPVFAAATSGTSATGASVAIAALNTTPVVSLTVVFAGVGVALPAGKTLTFKANSVDDLATTANKNDAVSFTVLSDTTVPTITGGVTYTVADATASLTIGSVTPGRVSVTSKPTGAAGAAWGVQVVNDIAAGINVGVDLGTKTILISHNSGTSTAAAIAAAINAAASDYVVAAEVTAGAVTAAVAARAALVQRSTITATTVLSEGVRAPAVADVRYDQLGTAATYVNADAAGTVSGSVLTTKYTVPTATGLPTPGTSKLDYSAAVTDIAGNPLVATTKTLTAG
jgi:putative cell wall-binding protein